MLILSRHVSEKILLTLEDGRVITLMPVSIGGDRVRIGIGAPATIQILREELRPAPERDQRPPAMTCPSPAA